MYVRSKKAVEKCLSWMFGLLLIAMALVVGAETFLRKAFNFSLQGADELSGYVLAIGSTIAFGLALIGRSHIRVDILYAFLTARGQAVLNVLAMLSLSVFSVFLGWMAIKVLEDTSIYGSTAATSWGTPLLYPQSVWVFALLAFSLISCVFSIKAIYMLAKRQVDKINLEFEPKSSKEELREELDSLAERQILKSGE